MNDINVALLPCTCNGQKTLCFLFVHSGEVYSKEQRNNIMKQVIMQLANKFYKPQPTYYRYNTYRYSGSTTTNSWYDFEGFNGFTNSTSTFY